ncbi:hemagglutinin repeat-containing protein [Rhizobium sp. LjRoot258]|uniref:hemagglutinin repeat-containing protein n=1 Tax=Rhizobium sp. LjRoot258 TaxID=3342299 RepID=UPI003ECF74CB
MPSAGKSNADGTAQVNSHVNGTGDITLKSGNDTRLAGAVVSGDTVTANVGGDLTIFSVPDTGASSNHSVSGGFSLGGGQLLSGVQIGGGRGSGEANWITEQSGLPLGRWTSRSAAIPIWAPARSSPNPAT